MEEAKRTGHPADRVLELWRERLLDLTRRNALLYLSRSRITRIRIVDPPADHLYNELVLREAILDFPRPRGLTVEQAEFAQLDSEERP